MANENDVLVTEAEVLDYLGFDVTDDVVRRNITRCIKVADAYLRGAVGENYPVSDPRAKELALMVVADLYDNRGMSEKVSANMRKLVSDFSLQLRMELRRSTA